MTVISLATEREARQPHWEGTAHCIGCHHEWVGEGPIGHTFIDCPSCGLPKGTPKTPFGPIEGDSLFICTDCRGEAFTAYTRKGRVWVRCMGCGTDVTEGFYS